MDSSGVPKKINRHVLKALITVLEDGLKFNEVLQFVQLCNKKLKPVPNIKQVVTKSLANFQKIGLIQRDNDCRYKITNLVLPKNVRSGRVTKRTSLEGAKQTFIADPNSWKRNNHSSDEEETVESTRKRFRTQKSMTREGKKVHLPHARKKNVVSLSLPKGRLFAGSLASAQNFDEDISMRETDETENEEFDDDESMHSHADEEKEDADKITEPPVTDDKSESVVPENQNNENSGETSTTTAPLVTDNADGLIFGSPTYFK